jgi:hypothetical protein
MEVSLIGLKNFSFRGTVIENGDVLEPYGNCGASRKRIGQPEEVTYFFDKSVHAKHYPHQAESQRRLNSHPFVIFLRPEDERTPARYP